MSPEELIRKLREKNAKATLTIETLVSHISNYKEVVEDEKLQLERALDAERYLGVFQQANCIARILKSLKLVCKIWQTN